MGLSLSGMWRDTNNTFFMFGIHPKMHTHSGIEGIPLSASVQVLYPIGKAYPYDKRDRHIRGEREDGDRPGHNV